MIANLISRQTLVIVASDELYNFCKIYIMYCITFVFSFDNTFHGFHW